MTEDEATCQVSAFFSGLGLGTTLSLPITASVGEAFVQFEYVEAEQAMAVLAVIYRFRTEPRPGVVEAVLAAATEANTGGGRLVLEGGRALVLRRGFTDSVPDRRFVDDVEGLAARACCGCTTCSPARRNRPTVPDGKACRRRQRALPVGCGLRGAADTGRATGPAV